MYRGRQAPSAEWNPAWGQVMSRTASAIMKFHDQDRPCVYGFPTSSPREGQDIVAHRHPCVGLWEWLHASMPGYDVLALPSDLNLPDKDLRACLLPLRGCRLSLYTIKLLQASPCRFEYLLAM